MIAWYNGDPWVKGTKAYREMQITHGKHVAISKKLELLSNEQINTASRITNSWCPERELLLKDFAAVCPFKKLSQRPYKQLSDMLYK